MENEDRLRRYLDIVVPELVDYLSDNYGVKGIDELVLEELLSKSAYESAEIGMEESMTVNSVLDEGSIIIRMLNNNKDLVSKMLYEELSQDKNTVDKIHKKIATDLEEKIRPLIANRVRQEEIAKIKDDLYGTDGAYDVAYDEWVSEIKEDPQQMDIVFEQIKADISVEKYREVERNVTERIENELIDEIVSEIKEDLKVELYPVVRNELHDELLSGLEDDLRHEIRETVIKELKSDWLNSLDQK